MKRKMSILIIALFTIACTIAPYKIKKKYKNDIISIEVFDKMPRKEAYRVIDFLYKNYAEKSKTHEFLLLNFDSLTQVSYWSDPPGSTSRKHTECKYEATFYIQDYAGETLCIGIYKNKLKPLWSSRWVESL